MTTRNLAVRLAVIDGGKVKAELKDVGQAGQRSLKRIEEAARPASRALKALDGAAGEVRGELEGFAGRLGPVGTALTRLGPAGLAAGAALAGVGLVLTKGIAEAAEAERSYRRLEAVLRATGFASGLTARDIAGFASAMERSTLASAEAVQDAASVLATFRSVAGDTFTRAIRLAQDLSAVFGQDLRSTATQLGKALEEPVQGISALRRVGVSFTASQRELIESLVETGRTAEAQKVILDALEQQVGGAGAAEARGLTGAANRLADAWGNLLESIGRTPAVSGTAESSLNLLARSLEGLATLFEEDPIGVRVAKANKALIEAEDKLARFRERGRGRAVVQLAELRVEQLRAEVDALIARARAESQAFAEEQRRADEGRRAADAAAAAEAVTRNLFSGMEDALVSFVTTGKLQFGDFARAIIADIARIAIRQAIIAPLLGAIGIPGGGTGGGLFAGLFHAGGVVGREAGPARMVPTEAFIGAPHFARGGVVGPDEVPAILHRGEAVLTPAQMAMLGERLAAREAAMPQVVINFNGPVSNAAEVRRSAAQAAANLARMVSAGRRGL